MTCPDPIATLGSHQDPCTIGPLPDIMASLVTLAT